MKKILKTLLTKKTFKNLFIEKTFENGFTKKTLQKLLVAGGMIAAMCGITFATGLEGYYESDVTPPWGRISVKSALKINDVNYIDSEKAIIEVYAIDDKCKENEIKYYVSTKPIADVGKISGDDWKPYSLGATAEVPINDLDTTNTIYAVFKDKNGNTSHIYNGDVYEQTVIFDMNTTDEVEFESGINTTRWHGAPFIIPTQVPTREGYYFVGWSTDKASTTASFYADDIVPADVALGTDEKTATLYAVWSSDKAKLPLLADVVKIGDYVDYPVVYDNVISYTSGTTNYTSSYNGWRVIGISGDTVNLVSAGVPLTFYNYTNQANSIPALTTNFLATKFGTGSTVATYRKSGFAPYITLEEVFSNKYTATQTDSGLPIVRSMTQEDIFGVTGHTAMSTGTGMGLSNAKYGNLLVNGAYYWLASPNPSYAHYLWLVGNSGNVYNGNSNEFGVRPVVSLKSDVLANGTNAFGVWNIEI